MSRVARAQCANCTCSPGLLSRTNRKSSVFAKRINLNRINSGYKDPNSPSRKGSVFTLNPSSLCLPEAKEVNTTKRLEKLRNEMKQYDLAVYIVPSEDQHQSEYTSAYDQKRSFISGFSGSAGIAIVTRDLNSVGLGGKGNSNNVTAAAAAADDDDDIVPQGGSAALSTDGRYFTQALDEMDFNWTLLKQGAKGEPTWEKWTVQQAAQLSLDSGSTAKIGVDPKLVTFEQVKNLNKVIDEQKLETPKAQVELVAVNENLINNIWESFETLPVSNAGEIKELDITFTGKSAKAKIEEVRKEVFKDSRIKGLVITALDEIAWLLNLRGSDIPYNPVFYSFIILTPDTINLYIGKERLSSRITENLEAIDISIKPYSDFYNDLNVISKDFANSKSKFFIPKNANWEVIRNLNCAFSEGLSTIELLKSQKNETELQGAKLAHLKDGRALIKFFAWLEDTLINEQDIIDEIAADEKLLEFRKQEDNFVGLSFDTISASGANGAVIHYKPVKGSAAMINPHKIYLNDSGSQFLEGTTDTTRTVHFAKPSSEQIRNYTLVLKGNIALATLKFPEGTTGNLIDSIARQFLWKYGLDYGHGTSHGVGAYLNVHEGPIGIGRRPNAAKNELKPGNLISNEPGFYKEGSYGIRLENVMLIKQSDHSFNGKKFLQFETITKVPFCKKLIDVCLLTDDELSWLNRYHAVIWNELSGNFDKNSMTYKWLRRETEPISRY
ncbi:AMPP [Candida oxycetoniae]|uniref:Xaa-Pro aminopeptidase n=1 Tax=Candida oxycetoniae TaxID=497107 RepID=A0AAI9WVG9_9ASCO|nr:AMPP [Candida oxycetoniae]KAI3402378.2 AMPP [Candida oxycetoniae]